MTNKRLRIAILANYPAIAALPPSSVRPKYRNREHPSSWTRSLCHALQNRDDIEVRLFVLSRAVTRKQESEIEGVPVTFVPQVLPLRLAPYHGYLPDLLALRPHIRKYAPDIVHGFGTESNHGVVATLLGVPAVVTIQGIVDQIYPFFRNRRLARFFQRRIERRTVRRADGLIAESGFAERWLRKQSPRGRIAHIPNAVNPEFFKASAQHKHDYRVLYVGSLAPWKAPDTLIRAFSKIEIPQAHLSIVGRGPLLKSCRALAHAGGSLDRIEFKGQTDRAGVIREMEAANVLAVPSRMDTAPNVVLEAHAAGLPVVGTRAGGIPDMIENGVDGMLVDVDDSNGMSAALHTMLQHRDRAKEMGAAGRQKVAANNNAKRVADACATFYSRVLASRRRNPTGETGI